MAQNPPVLTRRPEGRSDDVDRMRQRVVDLRVAMGRDVHELRGRVRLAFDLRRQAARHPFVTVAVVLGGVLLAATVARLLRGVRTPEWNGLAGSASRNVTRSRTGRQAKPGRAPAV